MDKVVDIISAIKKYKGFWKQVFSIIFLVVFNVKVLHMEAGGAFILTLAETFCATYSLFSSGHGNDNIIVCDNYEQDGEK